ncbi:hypothetical protein RRG08_002798 [Elysia crispata]|uniref:Uncharacterized protein n=1 Tax=Elysia crispata TaxID=231223 RepID=A0AAE0XUF5_9GAST|nr:hypothetical protein RRG08_002798 [Elysia crispata]
MYSIAKLPQSGFPHSLTRADRKKEPTRSIHNKDPHMENPTHLPANVKAKNSPSFPLLDLCYRSWDPTISAAVKLKFSFPGSRICKDNTMRCLNSTGGLPGKELRGGTFLFPSISGKVRGFLTGGSRQDPVLLIQGKGSNKLETAQEMKSKAERIRIIAALMPTIMHRKREPWFGSGMTRTSLWLDCYPGGCAAGSRTFGTNHALCGVSSQNSVQLVPPPPPPEWE